MSKLVLHPLSDVNELVSPNAPSGYTLNSSAREFLTDFHTVQPKVISSSVSAKEALNTMIKTHVRMMLVLDDHRQFIGMVTSRDVDEQSIIARALCQEEKVGDIAITELMQRKKDLVALSVNDAEKATIGEVVELLQDHHQQHCLVIDPETKQVRGVFSSSDISRKLQLPIKIQEQSSFSKVFSVTRS